MEKDQTEDEKARDVAKDFFGRKIEKGPENPFAERVQTSPAYGRFAATEGGGGVFDGMTDALLDVADEKTAKIWKEFQPKHKDKEPQTTEMEGRSR